MWLVLGLCSISLQRNLLWFKSIELIFFYRLFSFTLAIVSDVSCSHQRCLFNSHGVKLRWIMGFVACLLWGKPEQGFLSAAKKAQSSQQPRMWEQQDSNISSGNRESRKFLLITRCRGCLSGAVYSAKYRLRIIPTVRYLHANTIPWLVLY